MTLQGDALKDAIGRTRDKWGWFVALGVLLLIFGGMMTQRRVIEYQYVQERRDHFVMRVTTAEPDREGLARDLAAMMESALPNEPIRWEVEYVDRIERGATGKLRCIVIKPAAAAGEMATPELARA